MTPFETIMIICVVLIVLLMGFIAYRVDNNTLAFFIRTGRQLDNIKDDITDDRRDIIAMLTSINDVVDKMHRNICADVAEKMVDRAFPIKEGEPLDNPFIPSGATTWPPCYWGGSCTNPHRDCVNCPRPNVSGGTWTITSNKVELTDNDKQ